MQLGEQMEQLKEVAGDQEPVQVHVTNANLFIYFTNLISCFILSF